MTAAKFEDPEGEIKRVGKSGQISLGKDRAGQYFREEVRDDGAIVLTPVLVVARSHWTVRDRAKITEALDWAAKTAAESSDIDQLAAKSGAKPRRKQRAG